MKKALFNIACLFSFPQLQSQVMWQFNLDTVVTWHYQEGDEFNGHTLNTEYWQHVLWARSLYMNFEQEYYTDGQNLELDNGVLKLIAKKDTVFKRTIDSMNDNDSLFSGKKFMSFNKRKYYFTSGKVTTRKTFNKGYFECRFKIPSTQGYWPAFWLHGGSPNEEIDIMESETKRPTDIHVDTHCPNRCDMVWRFIARESFGAWIKTKTNFAEGFNVMACEWDENYIKFYLNGEFIAISEVKFNVPKHITVNLAVPSEQGPFGPGPGDTDPRGIFEVDYVRIWSKESQDSGRQGPHPGKAISDSSTKPMTSTLMKKRNKSYYGSKKNAKKEGIKVTLLRQKNLLEFTVLGNTFGMDPSIELLDGQGNVLKKADLALVSNVFDFSGLSKGNYNLFVKWNNKQTIYPIQIY